MNTHLSSFFDVPFHVLRAVIGSIAQSNMLATSTSAWMIQTEDLTADLTNDTAGVGVSFWKS